MLVGKQLNNLELLQPRPVSREVPSASAGTKTQPTHKAALAKIEAQSPEVQAAAMRTLGNKSRPSGGGLSTISAKYKEKKSGVLYTTALPVSKGELVSVASKDSVETLKGLGKADAAAKITNYIKGAAAGLGKKLNLGAIGKAASEVTKAVGDKVKGVFNTFTKSNKQDILSKVNPGDLPLSKASAGLVSPGNLKSVADKTKGLLSRTTTPAQVTVAGQVKNVQAPAFVPQVAVPDEALSESLVTSNGVVSPIIDEELQLGVSDELLLAEVEVDSEIIAELGDPDILPSLEDDLYIPGDASVSSEHAANLATLDPNLGYDPPIPASAYRRKTPVQWANEIKAYVISHKDYKSDPEGLFLEEMVVGVFESDPKYSVLSRSLKDAILKVYADTGVEPNYQFPAAIDDIPTLTEEEISDLHNDCPPSVTGGAGSKLDQAKSAFGNTNVSTVAFDESQRNALLLEEQLGDLLDSQDVLDGSLKGVDQSKFDDVKSLTEGVVSDNEALVGEELQASAHTSENTSQIQGTTEGGETNSVDGKLTREQQDAYNKLLRFKEAIPTKSEVQALTTPSILSSPDEARNVSTLKAYYVLEWVEGGASLTYESSPVLGVDEILAVKPRNPGVDTVEDTYEYMVDDYDAIVKSLEFHALPGEIEVNAEGKLVTGVDQVHASVKRILTQGVPPKVGAGAPVSDGAESVVEFSNGLKLGITSNIGKEVKFTYTTDGAASEVSQDVDMETDGSVTFKMIAPPGTHLDAKGYLESTTYISVTILVDAPSKDLKFTAAVA